MARTLNSDLVAAQQSSSATPYVRLVFHSFDRATTRTFATTDNPNRILQVQQSEGRFGSYTLSDGRPFIASSIIRLDNSSAGQGAVIFEGDRVYIEWGYRTASGIITSRSGPEFVINREVVSDLGVDYIELYTINLWELANLIFVNVANDFPLSYVNGGLNETKVSYILMELLGGGKLDDATMDDGGSFTDSTADSADTTTAFGLLPAVPVANDAFYFGQNLVFDRISVDVTQILSSGSVTLAWEYWDGDSWEALTPLTASQGATANTHRDLTSTGIQIEAFNIPLDWAKTTVDGGSSFYFVRMRVTAVSSPVTQIQSTRIFAGQDFGFSLDTNDAGQGDDFKPTYTTTVGSQLGPVIEDILSFTQLSIRLREDGFHAFFIPATAESPDQEYKLLAGPHTFFVHTRSVQLTIPNRVLVVSGNIDDGGALFSGTSNDTVSQGLIGIIPQIVEDASVTSDSEAATQADRIIDQLQRDKLRGRLEVPLHCGQEVWDKILVTDERISGTDSGRISQIVRFYQPGTYRMQIIMGGGIWAVQVPKALAPIQELPPAAGAPVQVPDPRVVPTPTVLPVPDPRIVPTPVPTTVSLRVAQGGPNRFRRAAGPVDRVPVQESLMRQRARRLQGPTEPFIGPRQLVESVMARRVRERRERRTNQGR